MADDSFQEKTEKATSRRREKAREDGKVLKSTELNSAALICLGFLSLWILGPNLAHQIKETLAYNMGNAPLIASSDPTFIIVFTDSMTRFFYIMLPIFAAMGTIAFGSNVAQVGFKLSTKSLEPKLEKLDVIKGLKQLFSLKSLVRLFRDSLKLFIVGFVAYKVIAGELPSFFKLTDLPTSQLASAMVMTAVSMSIKIGGVILILAILDYFYQKYEYEKSIKMSKQELKDEYKDTEGSPQIKSRIRQLQKEMSRSRMMDAVPQADVVVTNPTHIAVALQYNHDSMSAPTVVAKGERLIAQKIKELALKHNIPVVEDKPLARALFKICDVGQIVPMNLYRAVAEVLAHVYRLKGKVMG